jgi:hypothetical protein
VEKFKKIRLDLFKLHDDVDHSNRNWICFKGPNLQGIIDEIKERLIIKYRFKSVNSLCKHISKELNSNTWTIEQVLYQHKEWIPIPIIQILINMLNESKYKDIILEKIEYLKCNSSKSKIIKAVKYLDEDFCKIVGAHAADGNITSTIGIEIKERGKLKELLRKLKGYKIKVYKTCNRIRINVKNIPSKIVLEKLNSHIKNGEITVWYKHGINLTEGSKEAVFAFRRWLKVVFGIEVRVKKHGKKNAWRIDLDNKIIARYLNKFFNFPFGKKTYTVEEPLIIKNSSIKHRKAFLLGLLTFEGYVPFSGDKIHVLSKSKNLILNVKEILDLLGVPMRKIRLDSKKRWVCESRKLKSIDNLNKILDLFEKGTKKWQMIYYRIKGFQYKCKNIGEAEKIIELVFTKHPNRKIDILELFKKIKLLKKIKFKLLREIYGVDNSTLTSNLRILSRTNIISIINSPQKRTIIFNEDLNSWKLPSIIE